MSLSTMILVLAAASAQGNLMPWQTPAVHSLAKHIADIKGRRLQAALMSADCQAKCEGIADMIQALSGDEDDADIGAVYCPHLQAMLCVQSTDACIDEGLKPLMEALAMVPCICACPEVATMGEVAESQSETTAEQMAEVCTVVGCVAGADACAPMVPLLSEGGNAGLLDACATTAAPTEAATTDFASTQAVPAVVMGLTVIALSV